MMRNDEMIKLSEEIKQITRNLQEENIKKSKLSDEYAKLIQGVKKEYQSLNNEKRQLEDFLRKQEEQNQKIWKCNDVTNSWLDDTSLLAGL